MARSSPVAGVPAPAVGVTALELSAALWALAHHTEVHRANAPASIRGVDTRDRVRPTSCENVRALGIRTESRAWRSAKAPLLGVPETDLSELVAPLYDRLANADHTERGDGSAAFPESHRHAVTAFDSHARGGTHAGRP